MPERRQCRNFAIDETEGELASFETQRILAEQLPTPALEHSNIRLLLHGDPLEILRVGNETWGDAMTGCRRLQQDPKELDGRTDFSRRRLAML